MRIDPVRRRAGTPPPVPAVPRIVRRRPEEGREEREEQQREQAPKPRQAPDEGPGPGHIDIRV